MTSEANYVSPWMASVLALWGEFAVKAAEFGCDLPLLDPRLQLDNSDECRSGSTWCDNHSIPDDIAAGRKPHHQQIFHDAGSQGSWIIRQEQGTRIECGPCSSRLCANIPHAAPAYVQLDSDVGELNYGSSKTVDQAYPTCPASAHGHILEDPGQSQARSNHIGDGQGNACSEDPSTLQGCNIYPKKADFSEQEAEATLVARTLSLDSLIPRGPSFGTCAIPSMLQDLTVGHNISQLCRGVPDMKHFHHTVHEAFATWLLTDIVEWSEVAALHVFTDGAFVEETSMSLGLRRCS